MSRPNASDWHIAMTNEYNALVKNNTFSLEPRLENRIIIPCGWVFKTKYGPDGKVDKLKARAVAKGYRQVYGVDFFETYTPVTRMTSIRVIIAIAAYSNLELQQIDVDSAFLNGLIDAEIYMSQPPGFEDKEHPNYVCKLLKSLYSLKQAGRIWYQLVRTSISQIGLHPTDADPCVFVADWKEGKIIVGVHVDDFIMAGTSHSLSRFKDRMAERFKIKILDQAKFILGIQLKISLSSISISQETYLSELVKRIVEESPVHIKALCDNFHLLSYPIISNSIRAAHAASTESKPLEKEDISFYHHVLGKLMYAMVATHPDIAFTVNFLGRFMANPYLIHLKIMLCLIRYISGTLSLGI
jgi:hypothetical protein